MLRRPVIRILLAVLGLAVPLAAVTGCAGGGLEARPRAEAVAAVSLDVDDPSAASIAASAALFETSELAFVATAEHAGELADDAIAAGAPLLVAGPDLGGELDRLGATTVVTANGDEVELSGVTEVSVDASADPASTEVPKLNRTQDPAPAVLFTEDGAVPDAAAAPAATLAAVRGTIEALPGGDPRATSESVAIVREHPGANVLGFGDDFGASDDFAQRVGAAANSAELPGGGMLPLRDRILVADYGYPGEPVLGVLGEHDLDWAVQDVKERAAEYQALTDKQVVPTFEIIVTLASGSAGDDGDYSAESDPEALRPWIDRAAEEGIYVVLDLQPGLSSFPEQAQQYESLLAEPHVGLALDPEWRLKPGQKHLEQIGTVSDEEINETLDWLADFTAEHQLPQKVVVLHEFRGDMLGDRDAIDTGHDTLQLVVHIDGHGTPGLKMETWNALTADLPDGMALGWKNFIDEDTPTFTPAQTLEVEPQPQLVTY
ncbi:hypothetical protein [Gulosibacter sp. ACHW.36C]|uniref:Lipoprotein n=1 Tax=Gulosibacter sediminis TaxID=1729695 RepID=A0ABY4MWS7_9MICO|nr:hypothetical protein [Gulosibacter sediminis]UQN14577.1 hypothetical protein M3M28_11070 [Gulosibacter sediminis]